MYVRLSPHSPISQKPDTIGADHRAGGVDAYSSPTRPPSRPVRSIDDDTTSGRLAPINVAGTISTANDTSEPDDGEHGSESVMFWANAHVGVAGDVERERRQHRQHTDADLEQAVPQIGRWVRRLQRPAR